MNEDVQKIIKTSYLVVHKETFIYAKVKTAPAIDNHFFISKDADEITVLTAKDYAHELDIIEKSDTERSLLEVQFSPDSPDAPGFLAAVSSVLAQKGLSISVISTFSKDVFIVHKKDLVEAIRILISLGFLTR